MRRTPICASASPARRCRRGRRRRRRANRPLVGRRASARFSATNELEQFKFTGPDLDAPEPGGPQFGAAARDPLGARHRLDHLFCSAATCGGCPRAAQGASFPPSDQGRRRLSAEGRLTKPSGTVLPAL